MPPDHKPFRVLFVCMGNICRSPAAEIVFTQLVRNANLQNQVEIDSAGTIGYHAGNPPDSRMADTLAARGYEVFGASREIQRDDLASFDLILVADHDNLKNVQRLGKRHQDLSHVQLLTDYCTSSDNDHVPDPYYGGLSGFETVADLVEDACQGVLEHVKKSLS
ncbi:MAG: low molecular weight protein-tyrosine-phosphatase [Verrucomicrobiales bacterium]